MMKRFWFFPRVCASCLFAAGVLALCVAASKPAGRHDGDDGPVARLADAPEAARALKNPYAGEVQAVAAGRKLFIHHCASCHGAEGRGEGRAADLHAEEIKGAPAGVLFWAISNGRLRRGMPSWSGLPDAQRWQLVTYLKSLK